MYSNAFPESRPLTPDNSPPSSSSSPPIDNNQTSSERPGKRSRSNSSEPQPAMATPPLTRSSQSRTPSLHSAMTPPLTLESWENVSTAAHDELSRAFNQTTGVAVHKAAHMFVLASRSFDTAGYVPTKKTRPSLRKRRYSVDVDTNGWKQRNEFRDGQPAWSLEQDKGAVLPDTPATSFILVATSCRVTDEPHQRKPPAKFPDPRRFAELNPQERQYWPECNDETYLELPKSTLTNEDFLTITCLDSWDSWWRDSILSVALERISIRYGCEFYGIVIPNSMTASILYMPGVFGDTDNNNYANYSDYKEQFSAAKYIFLPINDGFGGTVADETKGLHWSLLVVDRVKMIASYIDGLFIYNEGYNDQARKIALGLGRIMGEEYSYRTETESPHQHNNNRYAGQDWGPCGPFVVTMVERYVAEIVRSLDQNPAGEIDLRLPYGYRWRFGTEFDSREVRVTVGRDIAWAKSKWDTQRIRDEHDAVALAGQGDTVTVIEEPEYDPQPEPVHWRPAAEAPAAEEEAEDERSNSEWDFFGEDDTDQEDNDRPIPQPVRLQDEEPEEPHETPEVDIHDNSFISHSHPPGLYSASSGRPRTPSPRHASSRRDSLPPYRASSGRIQSGRIQSRSPHRARSTRTPSLPHSASSGRQTPLHRFVRGRSQTEDAEAVDITLTPPPPNVHQRRDSGNWSTQLHPDARDKSP